MFVFFYLSILAYVFSIIKLFLIVKKSKSIKEINILTSIIVFSIMFLITFMLWRIFIRKSALDAFFEAPYYILGITFLVYCAINLIDSFDLSKLANSILVSIFLYGTLESVFNIELWNLFYFLEQII